MKDCTFAVTVPADARYLKAIRAFLEPVMQDLFADEADMLVLALGESCSNILKHRRGSLHDSLITVTIEIRSPRVRFRIGDFCTAEDLPNIKPRDLDDVRPGGLGTHFIGEIMDRVAYEPEPGRPGRLALVLEKAIPNAEPTDGS